MTTNHRSPAFATLRRGRPITDHLLIAAAILSTISHQPSAFAQGSLTPPGAPAATMKTLQQIEPRTDLQAPTLPPGVTTDGSYHFIINEPGSYYLSANLAVTKSNGIDVRIAGVTIDLNGFEIRRTAGAGGNGIEVDATAHRCTIKNGSITGFAYGLRCIFAGNYARGGRCLHLSVSGCSEAGLFAGEGWQLDGCTAHNNTGSGIEADAGSTLTNCTATANSAGTAGISCGSGSTLINCTANRNTTFYGILAGESSSLTNCSAYNNTADYGIVAFNGSSLTNCSAYANAGGAFTFTSAGILAGFGSTISHCTANNNSSAASSTPTTGMGFEVGTGSTIENCTARGNLGDGINIFDDTLVRDNTCADNGVLLGGDGAGIHSTGVDNRIEGNNVTNNDRGIDVDFAGNIIIKNSASGNTSNYEIVINNKVGPIVIAPDSLAISGSTGGAGVGSTNPWANFSY